MTKNITPKTQLKFCGTSGSQALMHLSTTRFTVVKKDSPSFYKPLARFAVVKTDSPNFHNPRTRLATVKPDSPRFCEPNKENLWELVVVQLS